MYWTKSLTGATLLFFSGLIAEAQITSQGIQQFLSDNNRLKNALLQEPALVKAIYQKNNFNSLWLNENFKIRTTALFKELDDCDNLGLNTKDYQFKFIQSFRDPDHTLPSASDSLLAELKLSDAFLHFYRDLAFGNTKPSFGYDGLNYTTQCFDIPSLLLQGISTNSLPAIKRQLAATLPEIPIMENELLRINAVLKADDFKEILVTSSRIDSSNKTLLAKLYQLGLLSTLSTEYPDSVIVQKVKEAQYRFNKISDGKIGKTTLKEINTPLAIRKKQLVFSLNYYRWLSCITTNRSVIVVNIPAAYLKVYRDLQPILEMRMVVGKKETPTYTLTSTVNEVILYPYWHVPHSIATKELLPIIKRYPGYIDAGNFQVLNSKGEIVNPYTINWQKLNKSYFPYLIRQSTGCDNALGLMKLNFYNPFGAYLHDTNAKGFFNFNNRFYSHGCMRMEKPMELGHLILKNNHIAIDTLEQKGCLRNQAPIVVHADEHMPVIVWYNPAGTDTRGNLIFFEDVYEKFNWDN